MENGLWLRHQGAWSQVDRSQAFALTRDPSGRIWVATAPDGWFGGSDAIVEIRRDVAGRWQEVPLPAGTFRIVDIAVDGEGTVWVSGISAATTGQATGWIVRRESDGWSTVWERQDATPGPFALSPSGRVWTTLPAGIAVIRAGTIDIVFRAPWLSSVSIAPDGTVWVAGPSGAARLRVAADAFEGSFERP
jgi:hypothetical protein